MRAACCEATVLRHEVIAEDIRLLTVLWPDREHIPHAGQFFTLRAWGADEAPFLSRPISVHKWDAETQTVEFLYAVVGEGTRKLTALMPGDSFQLTGPMGNGFDVADILSKYQKIAVVGGGLTGCEIAYELALQGKDVTIVEMKDDLVSQKGVCLANSSYLREWFAWKQVPVYLETTLREVKDGSIVCAAKDGSAVEIPCDTVISSAGYISTPLVEEKGHKNVQLVGDCLRVGNLRSVVWRAYETAMKI